MSSHDDDEITRIESDEGGGIPELDLSGLENGAGFHEAGGPVTHQLEAGKEAADVFILVAERIPPARVEVERAVVVVGEDSARGRDGQVHVAVDESRMHDRALCVVQALPNPAMLIEIECVASLGADPQQA